MRSRETYLRGFQKLLRRLTPISIVGSLYWSNETGHLIERQSMLINEVLYDRETYL